MPHKPINVMIVEDDEIAAKIYEQFTHKLDNFVVVATASSGKQALEMLKAFTPDLILLDIFLPDTNGIDLLREVRTNHRGIDVILITAANDADTVAEAIRGGAFSYIIKPILIDRFVSALEQYAHTTRQLKQTKFMDQTEVDMLFPTAKKSAAKKADDEIIQFPKGIDKLTLKLVRDKMRERVESINADDLANLVGMSHSTVRRYLEYLVSIEDVQVQTVYGTVGRPERRYQWMINSHT